MGQELRKPSLYDEDFYSWAFQQAELLRAGQFSKMDIENVAEEMETLGRSEASSLQSSLRLIIAHLLKISTSPRNRPRVGRTRSRESGSTPTRRSGRTPVSSRDSTNSSSKPTRTPANSRRWKRISRARSFRSSPSSRSSGSATSASFLRASTYSTRARRHVKPRSARPRAGRTVARLRWWRANRSGSSRPRA